MPHRVLEHSCWRKALDRRLNRYLGLLMARWASSAADIRPHLDGTVQLVDAEILPDRKVTLCYLRMVERLLEESGVRL